jgi:hypothetical protein
MQTTPFWYCKKLTSPAHAKAECDRSREKALAIVLPHFLPILVCPDLFKPGSTLWM